MGARRGVTRVVACPPPPPDPPRKQSICGAFFSFLWRGLFSYRGPFFLLLGALFLFLGSGVVGRERMGTTFPHKKLSGNGVPTKEILRDSFYYCYLISYFPLLPRNSYNIPCTSNHVKTGHLNLQSTYVESISSLKLISKFQPP